MQHAAAPHPISRIALLPASLDGYALHAQRVLVVDDRHLIAFTLCVILKQRGYIAECCTNPLEALEFARKHPIDLLITDVDMPELSGIELALRINELVPDCSILVLSAQWDLQAKLDAIGAHTRHFGICEKPVHIDLFLQTVDFLLRAKVISPRKRRRERGFFAGNRPASLDHLYLAPDVSKAKNKTGSFQQDVS